MEKELVKYDNHMNLLNFKGFSPVDLDVLMTLCAKMQEKDEEVMVFNFDYLKMLMQYRNKDEKRFVEELDRMNQKLMKVNSKIKIGSKTAYFVLFPTFVVDDENRMLTVRVNRDFKFLLNNVIKEFTLFELCEFTTLESKYSKHLYRLLKQYKRTGTYMVSLEDLRERMDIPKSYENRDIKEKVLKPAINELTEKGYFKGLKVEPKRAKKKGAPICGYEFTFQKSDQIPGQQTFTDPESFDRYVETTVKTAKPKNAKPNSFTDFEQRQYPESFLQELMEM